MKAFGGIRLQLTFVVHKDVIGFHAVQGLKKRQRLLHAHHHAYGGIGIGIDGVFRHDGDAEHLMIHRNTRQFTPLNKEEIVLPTSEYKKPARQIREIDEAKKLTMDYEIRQFSEEQIKKEAERCLKCGRSVVDTNKCIGCGMCTVQCKFDAIHLIRRPDGDLYSRMIPAEQKFVGIGKNMPTRIAGIIKKKVAGR